MTSNFETLTVQHEPYVSRITINRPDVLNALNQQVIHELKSAVGFIADQQTDCKLIILSGAGEKAFVAGADIREMKELSPAQARSFARNGQELTELLEQVNQLTLAVVDGFALGGGCELAMACDLILASTKAKFGQPEVGLGLIPGFGGTQRLTKRVGIPVAMDMLCAGRNLSGEEAFQLGLVSRVCQPDQIVEETNKIIKKILNHAPAAIAATKRLCRGAYAMELSSGLQAEADAFSLCFSNSEGVEGMGAFLEKRSANFSKKC